MLTDSEILAKARALVLDYGWSATSFQIVNPGLRIWLSPAEDAVVGYVVSGGYRVAAGEPVCSPDRLAAVAEEFEADAAGVGRRVCYACAESRLQEVLFERGAGRLLMGAQPLWHPSSWPGILARKASLRAQLYRARNKRVVVHQWSVERATRHPELERCLSEWLSTRGLPAMHFLVEPETLGRLYGRKVLVAEKEGVPVGFLVASPAPRRRLWLVEQIIRGYAAPNGTSELLLDAGVRLLGGEDADWITLGLSPLSTRAGIEPERRAFWLKFLLAWIRAHGRRFFDFDGLDAFKAKFLPDHWEPVYLLVPGRRVTVRDLYALTGAFSGLAPVPFLLESLGRAFVQELAWFREGVVGER